MSRTAEDVETFLLQLRRPFELEGGTYLVSTSSAAGPTIALRIVPPLVAIRMTIGPAPAGNQADLFRKLLEFNATDLLHVAYGIDQELIVLSAALELENLDANELDAALSDMDLAYSRHTSVLRQLAKA